MDGVKGVKGSPTPISSPLVKEVQNLDTGTLADLGISKPKMIGREGGLS